MTALLETQQLGVRYGAVRAVEALDLTVAPGELVALIGSNGAGKSSTLRALSNLVASTGTVRFAGESLAGVSADQVTRRGLVHVPEGRGIFAPLSVAENLDLGAITRRDGGLGADRERVLTLFPRLRERLTQAAGTLSGGEQQMLAIGRALLQRPRLLLLDEPSLGLGPKVVQTVFDAIRAVHRDGCAIILVEQNARLALDVADRAYVLERGVLALAGTAAALRVDEQVKKAYLGVL